MLNSTQFFDSNFFQIFPRNLHNVVNAVVVAISSQRIVVLFQL